MSKSPKEFSELQDYWYEKLKASGFEDIENTSHPERPLKEYHSRKFRTRYARNQKMSIEEYDNQLSRFLNSEEILTICKNIVSHGNCSITKTQALKILELHREGKTQRKIARKVKCSKTTVHTTLEKAREWMKVAA